MKVVITDHGFPSVAEERRIVADAGGTLEVAQCKTAEQAIAACRDADALLVQWCPISAEVVAALEKCRVIVRYGIGVDNVDLQAAASRGIAVCNIPDYCVDEVAEHALALALALARQLPQVDAALRAGTWKITPPRPFPALRDVVFATAGFGRIARAVLERAKAFGFQLAAYDPFVHGTAFAEHGIRQLDRDELFRQAGILSLHLPLTAETRHFVGRPELGMMLPEAILVNTARGGLIDTVALAEALAGGRLHGAGLDVFENEPLPAAHPLRTAPNAILTSHVAWYSAGSIPILQRKAAAEAVRGARGNQPLNVVNGVRFAPPARSTLRC
jgi:D-3-phosphoglycerate dehydrogenase